MHIHISTWIHLHLYLILHLPAYVKCSHQLQSNIKVFSFSIFIISFFDRNLAFYIFPHFINSTHVHILFSLPPLSLPVWMCSSPYTMLGWNPQEDGLILLGLWLLTPGYSGSSAPGPPDEHLPTLICLS